MVRPLSHLAAFLVGGPVGLMVARAVTRPDPATAAAAAVEVLGLGADVRVVHVETDGAERPVVIRCTRPDKAGPTRIHLRVHWDGDGATYTWRERGPDGAREGRGRLERGEDGAWDGRDTWVSSGVYARGWTLRTA